MFHGDAFKNRLGRISAKTLCLGGRDYVLGRNERKIKYSEAFEYTPLHSPTCFRLLRIRPGLDTDVVSVDLCETSLEEKPTFEALSYSWNLDPKFSLAKLELVDDQKHEERPVLCNGRTLHVTMNLYHALIQFRDMQLEIPLWADQICINQHDGQEKVAQLAIMTQIYTSAVTVVVWLGTLSRTRSWALDFMEALPDQPAPLPRVATHPTAQSSMLGKMHSSVEAVASFSASTAQNARWIATLRIFQRQWFKRIWTLQEFLLAKRFRIIMGSREISRSAIVNAAAQIIDFFAADTISIHFGYNKALAPWKSTIQQRASLFHERDRYQTGERYTAEEYLIRSRARLATVPKDKVFAGAALLEHGAPDAVSYSSTTSDIFCAFATERLWPQIGLGALPLVSGSLPRIEGLPSWVPDLSTSIRPRPLRHCGGQTFPAPINAGPEESFRIDGKTLNVRVAKWDRIDQIGESIWGWTNWNSSKEEPYNSGDIVKMNTSTTPVQERFGLMFALLDDLGPTYVPTGESSMTAFLETLLGGATSTSKEDDGVWQGRFFHYFAFNFLMMRSYLIDKRDESHSTPKPWIVSAIQDLPHMEERVSRFLEAHDLSVEGEQQQQLQIPDTSPSLRDLITLLSNRIWGADKEEDASAWNSEMGEFRAIGRGEEFYAPVSIFGDLFESVYDGRRIFHTTKGFLGIGTEGVRPGDEIYLVAGADVPYVLRPVEGAEAAFTLVGEAYVHGLMGGNRFSEAELVFFPVKIV